MKFFYTILFIFLILITTIYSQEQISADGITVSVYEFKQLEPLLFPSEKNDTIYIFNFWATFCVPCIKELPYFEKIAKNYSSEKVKVTLINLDFKSKIESHVIPFINKHDLNANVLILSDPDANSWIDKVDYTWSGAIPATLIVKGNNKEFYGKSFTYDELDLLLTKFLNK